jgi:hypothetical protein
MICCNMKPLATTLLLAISAFCVEACLSNGVQAQVNVGGYYRSNGTYVKPHKRTAPDSVRSNNYSYPGNYNPNSGRTTGGGSGSGYGSSGSAQRGLLGY